MYTHFIVLHKILLLFSVNKWYKSDQNVKKFYFFLCYEPPPPPPLFSNSNSGFLSQSHIVESPLIKGSGSSLLPCTTLGYTEKSDKVTSTQ